MAAWDHSDTACFARQWIEIDMKLDELQASDAMSSVVVPIRVTAIVVAATTYVIEVVAQQRAEHPDDIGMIKESG